MAVLLKNLLARSPKLEDMVAITELIKACDVDEHGIADSTMEDMSSNWHQPGFNLDLHVCGIGTMSRSSHSCVRIPSIAVGVSGRYCFGW